MDQGDETKANNLAVALSTKEFLQSVTRALFAALLLGKKSQMELKRFLSASRDMFELGPLTKT